MHSSSCQKGVLAVVTAEDPESGVSRGSVPHAQLFGVTAAVLRYNTVSRVMATAAARWLKLPRLGYSDDFGMVAAESTVQGALRDFAALNILGFELKVTQSEWGTRVEFLGATVTFLIVSDKCEAQLSASTDRVTKLTDEIRRTLEGKDAFQARTQKLVGPSNFARTPVMGKVG